MNSTSRGHIERVRRRTASLRSGRSARVTARIRARPARPTRRGACQEPLGSSTVFGWPTAGDGEAALQPAQTVREGIDCPEGRPRGLGEAQRVLDDGACRDEVTPTVLVEFGQLLPRARVEPGVARSRFPQRACGIPAGEALLPSREMETNRLRRTAGEPGRERGAIALE